MNRCLTRNHRTVQKVRAVNFDNFTDHFATSTFDKVQDSIAKCSFSRFHAIQCCCEKSSISVKLALKLSFNLVVVSVNLITQWKNDFRKLFEKNDQLSMRMKLFIVWYKISSTNYKEYDTWNDIKQRIFVDQKIWFSTSEQERYIIFTDINHKIYKEIFVSQTWRFVLKNSAKIDEREVLIDEKSIYEIEFNEICWNSITVDEFHLCKSITNFLIIHLKKFNNWFVDYFHFSKNRRSSINFNSRLHKWKLSKISWKKSFVDMLTSFKTLFSST